MVPKSFSVDEMDNIIGWGRFAPSTDRCLSYSAHWSHFGYKRVLPQVCLNHSIISLLRLVLPQRYPGES